MQMDDVSPRHLPGSGGGQQAWHFRHPGDLAQFAFGDGSASALSISEAEVSLESQGYRAEQMLPSAYVPDVPITWVEF